MSSGDPRFARLKSDPRFRRPSKQKSKVAVDDRFKSVFENTKKAAKHQKGRVDKYGRPLTETHENDNLRKFYKLENESADPKPDYARGEGLLESSSEEEDDEEDDDGEVILGLDHSRPIPVPTDEDEVDLDENTVAALDAQVAAYNAVAQPEKDEVPEGSRTSRLAIVNLDWDHVRASHLYKIFSSLVSPSATGVAKPSIATSSAVNTRPSTIARGKVISVKIYPSQFGKKRIAKEEVEGPPPEIFKKRPTVQNEEDVNEQTVYEVGGESEYDETALRRYQLERLRYYYAVAECDTVEAASHIYNELESTELERSANVFDLSFIPDGMSFDDDEPKEEATSTSIDTLSKLDFVTDALRHSKVKLTWDDDDAQRNQVTRRSLTKEEIERGNFEAYLASSGSDESDDERPSKSNKKASRDRMRALLLGGEENEQLPEGWGDDANAKDVDMEITFTSGLSTKGKSKDEENTLEKYERKMREKRKKRKEEHTAKKDEKPIVEAQDDFFDVPSDDELVVPKKGRKIAAPRHESTADELALIAASDNINGAPDHFDMAAILKAEKRANKKNKKSKKRGDDDKPEVQESFEINVKDDRFSAIHENHAFAIDPTHPQFKKTKSMAALLQERSERQKDSQPEENTLKKSQSGQNRDLNSLVESVKRKSQASQSKLQGKRRKLD